MEISNHSYVCRLCFLVVQSKWSLKWCYLVNVWEVRFHLGKSNESNEYCDVETCRRWILWRTPFQYHVTNSRTSNLRLIHSIHDRHTTPSLWLWRPIPRNIYDLTFSLEFQRDRDGHNEWVVERDSYPISTIDFKNTNGFQSWTVSSFVNGR